jgi:hypothetical protein
MSIGIRLKLPYSIEEARAIFLSDLASVMTGHFCCIK